MLRHLKTMLPVVYQLLEASVVTRVLLEQLCNRGQVSIIFDISQKDLLELTVGKKSVRMKPGKPSGHLEMWILCTEGHRYDL